jgi:hypothetical protein
MDGLALPLDISVIERIPAAPLPVPAGRSHHGTRARSPDRRHQERGARRALSVVHARRTPGHAPTVLTECVAQVGAILILSKPENRGRLILFGGIERVRFRHPVHAGDVVEIEARVKRLRSRMGVFEGWRA